MNLRERIEEFLDSLLADSPKDTPVERAYYQGKIDGIHWMLIEMADHKKEEEE